MTEPVPFFCPKHGKVLETLPSALVECRCGEECAPEGVTPKDHRKTVITRMRVARHRQHVSVTEAPRNRRSETCGTPNEAPGEMRGYGGAETI